MANKLRASVVGMLLNLDSDYEGGRIEMQALRRIAERLVESLTAEERQDVDAGLCTVEGALMRPKESDDVVCIRCNIVLDTDEGLQTGICSNCWKPETDIELFS